jgi:3-deoxy-D-manno-octulosonate 8-phosphate phosphatase (KDO 8-P phosphatase)
MTPRKKSTIKQPSTFILDVDGVMTTGSFFYTESGKLMKEFGPDDNDALSLISEYLDVRFVTGDRKGFSISEKRIVGDMGYKLDLVSTIKRVDWIKERFDLSDIVYMGDGIFDHYVMQEVLYSIAPANADSNAKSFCNHVTKRRGGDRAVSEAVFHLLEKFFLPFDPARLPKTENKLSGEWGS